jgi:hypothetical protein
MVAATEKTRTDIRFGVTIDSPDTDEKQPSALVWSRALYCTSPVPLSQQVEFSPTTDDKDSKSLSENLPVGPSASAPAGCPYIAKPVSTTWTSNQAARKR